MNSQIFTGRLGHARNMQQKLAYTYSMHMLWLDLDELPMLSKNLALFGHNKRRVLSIFDRDHLGKGPGTIREKLEHQLTERKIPLPDGRWMMLTCARYFNYVFNPVSFFYGYDRADRLQCIVAEVNNTFNEKHLYVLDDSCRQPDSKGFRYVRDKAFHVSPFIDLAGHYDFHFLFPSQGLDIQINLIKQSANAFHARLVGKLTPLTTTHLVSVLLKYPVNTFMTMTRIVTKAVQLKLKGAQIYGRPTPADPNTITRRPIAPAPPFSARTILRMLDNVTDGPRLSVTLPNGERRTYGGDSADPLIEWTIKDWRVFKQILLNGDIGLGESYMAGDWTSNDLTGFIRLLIAQREAFADAKDGAWHSRVAHRVMGWLRRNTLRGSPRNIAHHYDLSNELFAQFLDASMTYSSAYFERPDQSLESAQATKYRRICEKIGLTADDHVLEIGCGWGGFACFAAHFTPCRVTAITLSKEQYQYALERVRREGLEDRVEIRLEDYRHVSGAYDKIVSIEMFEAVGYAFYPVYFKTVDRLLKKGGVFLMQVIAIPDQQFHAYRVGYDWIRKYIFPGGLLPSLEAMNRACAQHTRLTVQDLENIGPHYAHTLQVWRDRFVAHAEEVRQLGFDVRFERMWIFYLCYCEAAFAERYLSNLHLVFSRPRQRTAATRV